MSGFEKKIKRGKWKNDDIEIVPDHGGGRRKQINACNLITHMVYL
jgi:hypothetical protein